MSCNLCGSAGGINGIYTSYNRELRIPDPDCTITIEMLTTWRSALQCIKASGKHALAGMSEYDINYFLGVIQSAINYPDDYCYYKTRFESFQVDKLPLIVTNVPECI